MVKNRYAVKALNKKDEPIMVSLELDVSNMEIEVKTFPFNLLEGDESDFIQKFTSGEEVVYPDGVQVQNRNFTEDSILPDDIKIEGKTGAIRQLQNEWSYLLLKEKLFEQFNSQLEDIKQKASEVKEYSHELFDESRDFWEKVLEYKKEREISQERLTFFKEEINGVFDHLKALRESMQREKDEVSEKIKEEITEVLQKIDAKVEEQGAHFNTLMDELKAVQARLRSEDVKRDIKNILFDNIQSSFEKVKARRTAVLGNASEGRIEGLNKVIDRMTKSLDRDKKDLEYFTKKLDQANNKMELQLREAKITVIRDRVETKEEKLADIRRTLAKLSKKSASSEITQDEVKKEDGKESKKKNKVTEDLNSKENPITDLKDEEVIVDSEKETAYQEVKKADSKEITKLDTSESEKV